MSIINIAVKRSSRQKAERISVNVLGSLIRPLTCSPFKVFQSKYSNVLLWLRHFIIVYFGSGTIHLLSLTLNFDTVEKNISSIRYGFENIGVLKQRINAL